MILKDYVQLSQIAIHQVGNKLDDEGIKLSTELIDIDENIKNLLIKYFLSSFKDNLYYNFHHESDINLNEIYSYSRKIFNDQSSLYEQSVFIAKHLYEHSQHPKIKGGELYIVYLKDCVVDGDTMDAIGIFKSETKESYLKVESQNNKFSINSEEGIDINKLDKGCLIFNGDKDKGYIVAVVDNSGKGNDARYWMDDFLHIRQRKDEYYNTQNVLSLCKNFVTKELPQQFEVSKADQADLLNKSVKFFKEKETFNMDEFANEVIAQPEIIDSFNGYKSEYQKERDIEIADSFTISDSAVKKQSRILKSVIKLDKNFHIYVHGNNQYIKKGYDEETGLHYYQLFFKDEQ